MKPKPKRMLLRRDRARFQAEERAKAQAKERAKPRPRAMTRERRALATHAGEVTLHGDHAQAEPLAAALRACATAPTEDLTHGFHAHPARMHPVIPAQLIPLLSKPGDIVLDPFVGGGTVLVEALAHGRRAAGVDLDPLALRIAETRCQVRSESERKRFSAVLRAVAAASEERVRTRTKLDDLPIPREERVFYDPHVMLELSGLLAEITSVPQREDRRALELVFSAIVVKFSRQRADTSEEIVPKRIRKGLVTEFFLRKGEELLLRWEALADAVPSDAQPARLWLGDARYLTDLLGMRFRASLVLTSPPYGGTYDYVRHHARRHSWLKLDTSELQDREIGARRNLSRKLGARRRWDDELGAALASIAGVLAPEGRIVFFIGDGELDGERVEADRQLLRIAPERGLAVLAGASQERPDYRGGSPRREHLILLAHARPERSADVK
jgi:hypothetical protein